MRYKVEFLVPMNDPHACEANNTDKVWRGFYVYTTTNLAKAFKFAETEAAYCVCPGGAFQVVHPDSAAIMQEFPCKG